MQDFIDIILTTLNIYSISEEKNHSPLRKKNSIERVLYDTIHFAIFACSNPTRFVNTFTTHKKTER